MIAARKHLKRLWFELFKIARGDALVLRRIAREDLVVILGLHQVRPERNPYWEPLQPAWFDELLAFIKPRFRVTTLAGLRQKSDDRRPALVLTFDDGYYDYVEYALPLLHRHGLVSNQNVIVDCVRSGRPPDIVRLCDFLAQAPRSLLDEIRLPGAPADLRLTDDSERARAAYGSELCYFVKMRSRASAAPLWEILDPIIDKLDGFRPSRMMTLAEVKSVAQEHEVGCHSMRHDSMEFETDAFLEDDVVTARAYFRDELGTPMRVYAFPNGSCRPSQSEVVLRHDVEHVLLAGETYSRRHAAQHPRFTLWADSRSELRARAVGFPSWVAALRRPRAAAHMKARDE